MYLCVCEKESGHQGAGVTTVSTLIVREWRSHHFCCKHHVLKASLSFDTAGVSDVAERLTLWLSCGLANDFPYGDQ